MRTSLSIFAVFILFALLPTVVKAQLGNEFQIANRLMKQQNYEAALPVFEKLVADNPSEFYFLERYLECFIQLKRYDDALNAISEIRPFPNLASQVKVLEAELYHFKGDTAKAYTIWDKNLAENTRSLQLYISTSNVMSDLKEFDKAVKVLRTAREVFNNPQLFYNDISTTLLQAGNYEGAVREWIAWLTAQPDQISNIQRTLLRFNDPLLNDITILEIDDKLNEIPITNPAYSTLFRFQIWLLQENKLYRRAVASASAFENSTSNFNYSLFQLGRSLRRNKEFELAVTAFEYYIQKAEGNVKWQSREELAKVYSEWAKQVEDFNLDFTNQKNTLFSKALEQINLIIQNAPNYRYLSRVLLMKSEIVLDHLHDLDAATNILSRLRNLNKENESSEEFYIQGRIQLANREYSLARISLTKSNKLAEIGELAEKTRYFLALTDFFSSDYEFATIQLKTLGRQNTSYYANDALELRLWIQEGLTADSSGSALKPFADAYFETLIGNNEVAKNRLTSYLNNEPQSPLYDDAVLMLSKNPAYNVSSSYNLTNEVLAQNKVVSNRERLMWERAKYADQAYSKAESNPDYIPEVEISISQVISYYEELILDYPQGFYAPYARKRLTELSKKNI
ncbi:MAG: tetratricopeptide repeat protein [Balneola sp.]|nr:tetratricopeptide repeat protein [Balneola sp.]MBO6651759.1 tetratricopeptide repeat protein [Balneola sp.]MBO6711106.1 tetratricopeptide repeat protein [Balneola sp.]MBO6869041.1 tetratricopeptide repeat protein [Balneola sp.]